MVLPPPAQQTVPGRASAQNNCAGFSGIKQCAAGLRTAENSQKPVMTYPGQGWVCQAVVCALS